MKQTVQKLDNFINENKNLWVLLKVNWDDEDIKVLEVGNEKEIKDMKKSYKKNLDKRSYTVDYEIKTYKVK